MYKSLRTERASAKGVSRILFPQHASVRETQNGRVGCFLRTHLSSTPSSPRNTPRRHSCINLADQGCHDRTRAHPCSLKSLTSHKNSNRTSTWHQQCPIHCQRFGTHSQAIQFTPIHSNSLTHLKQKRKPDRNMTKAMSYWTQPLVAVSGWLLAPRKAVLPMQGFVPSSHNIARPSRASEIRLSMIISCATQSLSN